MHCTLMFYVLCVSKEGQGLKFLGNSFIFNKVLNDTTCDMSYKQVAFLFFLCCDISPLVALDSWES
jgi:hypothetical protein